MIYVPDKPGHGTIQPSRSMTAVEYQGYLAGLQDKFTKVDPLETSSSVKSSTSIECK